MINDFKEFALKGNLIDMAVGIVMGGAVAAICLLYTSPSPRD